MPKIRNLKLAFLSTTENLSTNFFNVVRIKIERCLICYISTLSNDYCSTWFRDENKEKEKKTKRNYSAKVNSEASLEVPHENKKD